MISLLLATLIAQTDGDCGRGGDRCRSGRDGRPGLSRAGGSSGAPLFSFGTSGATGLGAECACGDITSLVNGASAAVTWSRNSAAICTKSDYSVVSCPSNKPRVMTGGGNYNQLGVFCEPAASNRLSQWRDLSQIQWVKVNVTCVANATGVDGAANSASTCTATAANGTVCQTLVALAADANASMYMKHTVGVGAVSVAHDGASYDAITSSLSSSLYKRVVSREAVGCFGGNCINAPDMMSSLANPVVCIKIATSGDAVVVDMAQEELGLLPTSPTPDTHAAERGAISISTTNQMRSVRANWLWTGVPTSNTARMRIDTTDGGAVMLIPSASTPSPQLPILQNMYGGVLCEWLGTQQPLFGVGMPTVALGPQQVSCDVVAPTDGGANSSMFGCVQGLCLETDDVAPVMVPATIYVCSDSSVALSMGAVVSDVVIDTAPNNRNSVTHPPTASTVLWLSDGIANTNSLPYQPWNVLSVDLRRAVFNVTDEAGVAGIYGKYFSGLNTGGYQSLIYANGIVDISGGASAVTTWSYIRPVLDDARTRGYKVIPWTLLPWAGYTGGGWSGATQTATENLNQMIRDYSNDAGLALVDGYALFGGGLAPDGGLDPKYLATHLAAGRVGGAVNNLDLGPDGGLFMERCALDAGP